MRYRQRVAIQAPVQARDSMGGVVTAYETVDGLGSVPATVRARSDERRLDQMTPVEDAYEILLDGVRQVAPEMVVLDGSAVYDVDRVTWTEAGWPHPSTLVEARRVTV